MSGYLADTSVFVAAEQRRPLGPPPEGILAELAPDLRVQQA